MSHNPTQVKRSGLVWFVCLCVQVSAVAAPFAHVHPDAAHETSHHDGRVAHSHFSAHATDSDHHHDHDGAVAVQTAASEDASEVGLSTEPASIEISATIARPVSGMSLSPPERDVILFMSAAPVTPPPDDVGDRLLAPPDLPIPSLRGPPR